jgi:hypothetical protein
VEQIPDKAVADPKPTATLQRIRVRLSRLWLIMSGCIAAILIGQSIAGRFGDELSDIWGWALPNLVPTVALMLGIMGAEAVRPSADPVPVSASFSAWAFWLSAFYLANILVLILAEPLTPFEPLELLKMSNLWLGPVQGLVTSVLGFLFFSERRR